MVNRKWKRKMNKKQELVTEFEADAADTINKLTDFVMENEINPHCMAFSMAVLLQTYSDAHKIPLAAIQQRARVYANRARRVLSGDGSVN